ncbi:MAG: hypothetical protein HC773_22050 [Scytonema sp. CRU_2_7]|nr:hypothetical protein [Scytonema sp. CRU_2_7]
MTMVYQLTTQLTSIYGTTGALSGVLRGSSSLVGTSRVSSPRRVPRPPAMMTTQLERLGVSK